MSVACVRHVFSYVGCGMCVRKGVCACIYFLYSILYTGVEGERVCEEHMYAHLFTHIRTHAHTQVRLKIKHMEIEIRKRESTGSGSDLYNESETITKFEIMDGVCVCVCVCARARARVCVVSGRERPSERESVCAYAPICIQVYT